MEKLPGWVETSEDYERWKKGEGPRVDHSFRPRLPIKNPYVIGLISVCLLVGISFYYIKGTPHYSLYKFKKALLKNDPETALKYLDIDSIVDNLMSRTMMEMTEERLSKNEWENAGRAMGIGIAMMMKPAMKEFLKTSFKQAVTNPDKDKTDIRKLKDLGFNDYIIERIGNTALISPKNDPDVSFKMTRIEGGYWKIVDIINKDEDLPGPGSREKNKGPIKKRGK